jgi:hypothetical protein
MTEEDYILVADLRTVRHLVIMLNEIIPANNPHISASRATARTKFGNGRRPRAWISGRA